MILLNSCELMRDDCVTADDEGRVWLPNRMNFRKSAKGGAGVHFQSKIYIGDFGPLYGAFSDVLQKQIAI